MDAGSEHNSDIITLSFSPTGSYLATGDESGHVVVWDVPSGKKETKFYPDLGAATALLWAPFSLRTLMIGGERGSGSVVSDVLTENLTAFIKTGTYNVINSMDVDVETRMLALAVGPEVHLAMSMGVAGHYISNRVFPKPHSPPGLQGDIHVRPRVVHLERGAKKLIVAYLTHGIVCWDAEQETQLWQIFPESRVVGFTAVSKDFCFVFVSTITGKAELYYAKDSNKRPRVVVIYDNNQPGPRQPSRVALLDHESNIACGSEEGVIRVWDLKGELQQELRPMEGDHPIRLITAQAARGTGHLAGVINASDAPDILLSNKIYLFSNKFDRGYWNMVFDFMFASDALHVQEKAEHAALLLSRYAYAICSILVLAVAALSSRLPFVRERTLPQTSFIVEVLYDLLLLMQGLAASLKVIATEAFRSAMRGAATYLNDLANDENV
ncbi:unnamed protein product [Peniophora sp. CBMAI 1063]|nr:unnamed protein product [Peniophora sp. CBMAI 1063]